ncbi:MAG: Na(+)/H(+) antiporter subunit B [Firmicutes bacterium]|nr:Na(+)/H(+) antiporter subunit B [Bacillota bacterium]
MKSFILETVSKVVLFVILIFSFYLLLRGHNAPGGGFIAGLMTSATFILLYLALGPGARKQILPLNFRAFIPVGLLISALTGLVPLAGGKPFLTSAFGYADLPVFGEIEWATAMLFDFGVYLVVVGVTMSIISVLGEE